MKKFVAICVLTYSVRAQSEADKKKYSKFHLALAEYGYEWEPHKVKTEDGWHLTMFRLTSHNGE